MTKFDPVHMGEFEELKWNKWDIMSSKWTSVYQYVYTKINQMLLNWYELAGYDLIFPWHTNMSMCQ